MWVLTVVCELLIPSIRTDHSATTFHVSGIKETGRSPSFWKFNSSFLEDKKYIKLITDRYSHWMEDGKDLQVPSVLGLSTKPYMEPFFTVNRRLGIGHRH